MAAEQAFPTVEDPSAKGIARAVSRAIRDGSLETGTRLPTVRELAKDLDVSPATVSEAWRILGRYGMIETRGRNGTVVCEQRQASDEGRYRQIGSATEGIIWDLATGTPDPELLPQISQIIGSIDVSTSAGNYLAPPIISELAELLRGQWPYEPEMITIVDGCMDGVDRAVREVCRYGDAVIVEHPTFPPILDILDRLGVELLPVQLDEEGIRLDSLESALEHNPVAMIYQPRAHNPTGITTSVKRLAGMSNLLDGSRTIVIEDDHAGAVADASVRSVGSHLPGQVVTLLGFSKSYGPDLRLGAMGGTSEVIDKVLATRLLGAGWSSRLLQRTLLALLQDPETARVVDRARAAYALRRSAAVEALAGAGLAVRCDDGINLWLPVHDERLAIVALAARGIRAAAGSLFEVSPGPQDHVRLTIGLVPEWTEDMAAAVAAAAQPAMAIRSA